MSYLLKVSEPGAGVSKSTRRASGSWLLTGGAQYGNLLYLAVEQIVVIGRLVILEPFDTPAWQPSGHEDLNVLMNLTLLRGA